ncbi:MAG: DVU0772 family protein [Desulfohalobiaceae bacterium]
MNSLRDFKDLPIEWDLEPADAVARHLEWGNTGYGGHYGDAQKVSYYFSVDTWQEPYLIRLQKMTKDGSQTLHELELPREFYPDYAYAKGTFALTLKLQAWLLEQMEL